MIARIVSNVRVMDITLLMMSSSFDLSNGGSNTWLPIRLTNMSAAGAIILNHV
jgi:hypothetical protein